MICAISCGMGSKMKLRGDSMSSFSKHVTINEKGDYEVSIDYFKTSPDPEYLKKKVEHVINGPQLYQCDRCGTVDTKYNLLRGVEHPRIQCELASYRHRVYDSVSDKAKKRPWLYKEEIEKAKKNIKFQDDDLYGYNSVLIDMDVALLDTFDIPVYESKKAPDDWWKFM